MIKKLILLGFGLALLIGLPLTIFVLQNQTQSTSGAAPVTKFAFDGPTAVSNGQSFDEKLSIDPNGTNQVSFVKFTFTYDPAFLDKGTTAMDVDPKFITLVAPSVTCTTTLCTVTGTISIGSNKDAIIKTKTDIATMHLIAKADTNADNPTQLLFVGGQNQALSVGASDQAAENVFQTGVPASITIGDQSGGGGGTPSDTPAPTDSGGGTLSGGESGGGTGGTSSGGGTTGTGNNLSVSCTSFTADKTTGDPPLTVTFTTVGSSSNDSISNIALTYGDGATDTVATGSGIGTGNINNQISHTYSGNGSFTANAVLTTAGGATSDPTTCKQTISVGAAAITQAAGGTASGGKLPPTGPGQTFVLIGAAGAILTVVGFVAIAGL